MGTLWTVFQYFCKSRTVLKKKKVSLLPNKSEKKWKFWYKVFEPLLWIRKGFTARVILTVGMSFPAVFCWMGPAAHSAWLECGPRSSDCPSRFFPLYTQRPREKPLFGYGTETSYLECSILSHSWLFPPSRAHYNSLKVAYTSPNCHNHSTG